jgi:hypothetical protein
MIRITLAVVSTLLFWSFRPAAAQTGPEAPPSVKIAWDSVSRISGTTPSLQVVVNPPLRRGSKIHDRVFQAQRD